MFFLLRKNYELAFISHIDRENNKAVISFAQIVSFLNKYALDGTVILKDNKHTAMALLLNNNGNVRPPLPLLLLLEEECNGAMEQKELKFEGTSKKKDLFCARM